MAALLPVALAACSAVTPDKMTQIKPSMTPAQVEALLGQPARIDHSETSDQTLNGDVFHYPTSTGEGRVVFVNNTVFKAEFIVKS